MKKIFITFILTLIALCSFITVDAGIKRKWSSTSNLNKYENVDTEFRAVWVCTVGNMDIKKQEGTSETAIEEWKKQYISVLDNAQAYNLNTIIFQIRPCNDAFYPSKYNPWSQYLVSYGKDPGWDPLEWMIEVTHERGLEYHAWMNPYRVTTTATEKIVQNTGGNVENVYDYDNEALQAAKQKVFGDMKSKAIANGMKNVDNPVFYEGKELEYNVVLGTESKYVLNPASENTITHLENTIREVVENYDIDGIHFDDYFYPNDCNYISSGTNNDFKGLTFSTESYTDFADYQNYIKTGGSLSIYDWRRENINTLIKNLSEIIRETNKTKKIPCAFGISPAGRWAPNPESCPAGSPRPTEGGMYGSCGNYYSYSDLFADTKKWVDEEWIDYLLPQVYSELGNGYDEVIDWWSNEMKDSPVKLYVGTAAYQIDQWGDTTEIYYQIRYNQSIGNRTDGYAIFRYVNLLNGKGKNAMNLVSTALWKTNALTPLYNGYNYKHEVSQLAEINKIVEGTNDTRRMYYDEVEDAKAYILYRTTSKQPSELNATDIFKMNLKNNKYFDIEYSEEYKYYLATVSQDNTIYLNENEISFENTEFNQPPVITLESKLYKNVVVETKVVVEFKIIDPEGKELDYKVYIVENGKDTALKTTKNGDIIKVEWEAPFVDINNLKFKVVVSDTIKESIYETELFDVVEKCIHSYESATCDNPSICTLCGKVVKPALGHDWVDATCEEEKCCRNCNIKDGVALGHTEVVDEKIEPTCETTGLTEGSHCSVCNKVLVEQVEIETLKHTEVTDEGYEATCDKTGLTDGSHCSVCNKVLVPQETIEALGHTEVKEAAKDATCEETGLTEGKHCSVCKKVLVEQQTIESLGHTEVKDAAKGATCEETGLTEGKHCLVCNKVLVEQEIIKALGHNWVDATCEKAKYCKICNKEDGTALGHTEVVDAAKDATCEQTGLTEGKHCLVCNKILVEQKEVKILGHAWVDATKKAPKTCSVCGKTEGDKLKGCKKTSVITILSAISLLSSTLVLFRKKR